MIRASSTLVDIAVLMAKELAQTQILRTPIPDSADVQTILIAMAQLALRPMLSITLAVARLLMASGVTMSLQLTVANAKPIALMV